MVPPKRGPGELADWRAMPPAVRPEIRFCTSADGTHIAYASAGRGAPLVKSANWMTHLELDRDGPLWQHWFEAFSAGRRFVTYDGRGYGLSDRRPPALTFDAMVDDLAAVVDAAGLDRFPLIGFCHGGPIGIAYAARHPERVSCLVLSGTYALGRARRLDSEVDRVERDVMLKLIEIGWGQDSPAFRQVFTSKAVPGASADVFAHFNALQRASASAETAIALTRLFWDIDVVDLLEHVRCPTLVLHARRDAVVPFEQGRLLAGSIAGGTLMPLESENHDLLAGEPAWPVFVAEVQTFLDRHDAPATPRPLSTLDALTAREHQVLDAIARGLDNAEIAAALHLSDKTIRNHVSNLFSKLQVTSRNRAIVLAREAGFGADPRRPGTLR